jgi:hypothetical protein
MTTSYIPETPFKITHDNQVYNLKDNSIDVSVKIRANHLSNEAKSEIVKVIANALNEHFLRTTNDQRPFITGDIIEWAGDFFEVLENLGDSGIVREYWQDGETIYPFYWVVEGESCVLANHKRK